MSSNSKSNLTRWTIDKISRLSAAIAIVFLLGMMVVVVTDVFLRFAFRAPILGSMELVELFMPVAGFLGMAWCAQNNGHVLVGVLVDRLPQRTQSILDCITLLLGMCLVPLVTWQSLAQAKYKLMVNASSSILKIPYYPFYIVVGVGYAILFLVLLVLLFDKFKSILKYES